VELAIVTHTGPDAWRYQEDATLATAVDVLDKRNEAERRAAKGKRRG